MSNGGKMSVHSLHCCSTVWAQGNVFVAIVLVVVVVLAVVVVVFAVVVVVLFVVKTLYVNSANVCCPAYGGQGVARTLKSSSQQHVYVIRHRSWKCKIRLETGRIHEKYNIDDRSQTNDLLWHTNFSNQRHNSPPYSCLGIKEITSWVE